MPEPTTTELVERLREMAADANVAADRREEHGWPDYAERTRQNEAVRPRVWIDLDSLGLAPHNEGRAVMAEFLEQCSEWLQRSCERRSDVMAEQVEPKLEVPEAVQRFELDPQSQAVEPADDGSWIHVRSLPALHQAWLRDVEERLTSDEAVIAAAGLFVEAAVAGSTMESAAYTRKALQAALATLSNQEDK